MNKLPKWNDSEALWALWRSAQAGPIKLARLYFPARHTGYVTLMDTLVAMAVNRAIALKHKENPTTYAVYMNCVQASWETLKERNVAAWWDAVELTKLSGWK